MSTWSRSHKLEVAGIAVALAALIPTYRACMPASPVAIELSSVVPRSYQSLALLDVLVRNPGGMEALVHRAEIEILEGKPQLYDGNEIGGFQETTHLYHAVVRPGAAQVSFPLAQTVPSGGVDRFQVSLGLGEHVDDGRRIESPSDSETGRWIVRLETLLRLRLFYNSDRVVESDVIPLRLTSAAAGRLSSQPPPTNLAAAVRLLQHDDPRPVQGAIEYLAALGDPAAVGPLRDLRSGLDGHGLVGHKRLEFECDIGMAIAEIEGREYGCEDLFDIQG